MYGCALQKQDVLKRLEGILQRWEDGLSDRREFLMAISQGTLGTLILNYGLRAKSAGIQIKPT